MFPLCMFVFAFKEKSTTIIYLHVTVANAVQNLILF